MWIHRHTHTQRTLCWQCCRPQCTAQSCRTCRVCRSETCRDKSCAKDMTMPHAKLLPTDWSEVQSYICLSCRYACNLCGEAGDAKKYTHSMWRNRSIKNRLTLCLQCCNPPCAAPECKTCVVCRSASCKRRKCNATIEALPAMLLPSTLEDVRTFLCQRCRDITCQCGTRMTATMQKKRSAALNTKPYVCLTCQTREQHKKDTAVKFQRR